MYQVSRRRRCTERAEKCTVSALHTSTCTDNSDHHDDDDDDDVDDDVSRHSSTNSTAPTTYSCYHTTTLIYHVPYNVYTYTNKQTQRNRDRDAYMTLCCRDGVISVVTWHTRCDVIIDLLASASVAAYGGTWRRVVHCRLVASCSCHIQHNSIKQ